MTYFFSNKPTETKALNLISGLEITFSNKPTQKLVFKCRDCNKRFDPKIFSWKTNLHRFWYLSAEIATNGLNLRCVLEKLSFKHANKWIFKCRDTNKGFEPNIWSWNNCLKQNYAEIQVQRLQQKRFSWNTNLRK